MIDQARKWNTTIIGPDRTVLLVNDRFNAT